MSTNPCSSQATLSRSQVVHGEAPRKRKRKRKRKERLKALAAPERDRLELAVGAVQLRNLAPIMHRHAITVEIVDQVFRHRFAQVSAAMKQGNDGTTTGQPDRRLGGGVAAADDADARCAAPLRLRWSGGVEDARALGFFEVGYREAAVLGPGGQQDGTCGHAVIVLESHYMAAIPRFQCERPVGRGRPGRELARLGDRARGELGAADTGRESEVVLDPP